MRKRALEQGLEGLTKKVKTRKKCATVQSARENLEQYGTCPISKEA